ncbi:MAG: phage portal protein [Pseudonocardia sp.]|nr:phage portal protein [Pseudonocardia sp.]
MRALFSAFRERGAPTNAARRPALGYQLAPMTGRRPAERLLHAMGEVSTLFAIVDRLASSTASVHWDMWRKAPSGQKKDRELVTKHAALDLWRKPNRHMTQARFVHAYEQFIDLTGEGPWLLVKAGGVPVGMWPVRPDRLEPVPSGTDFLSGYVYSATTERVPLGVDDVIRPMMPNPLDPYRGLGPVQALLTHLDATRYSAEWNRNFFANSAAPGGVVEVPYKLDDVEFEDFRERWAEQHQGVSNAHRVALLEDGFKWVDATYTRRDMQFAELEGLGREVIREGFGFPKAMLGAVEDVNRANAEAGEVVFGRWLIVPRLERIKDHLNNELLPMFYPRGAVVDVEFDYVPPVPEDRAADNEALQAQTTAFSSLITAGVAPEAAAAHVGMPPTEMVATSGVTPQLAYAAVALVKGGFDAEQTLSALGLPAIDWAAPPEPAAGAGFGEGTPAQGPPKTDDPGDNA